MTSSHNTGEISPTFCLGRWACSLPLPRFLPPVGSFVLLGLDSLVLADVISNHPLSLLAIPTTFTVWPFVLVWPCYPSHFLLVTSQVDQGIRQSPDKIWMVTVLSDLQLKSVSSIAGEGGVCGGGRGSKGDK